MEEEERGRMEVQMTETRGQSVTQTDSSIQGKGRGNIQVEQIAPQGPRLDWKSRLVLQLFTMAFSTLSFRQRDPTGQDYRCEEQLP